MTDDQPIDAYLQQLQASLQLPRPERARAVEEIEHHLWDAAADHQHHGQPPHDAVALAIEELGAPEEVAAAFNDSAEAPRGRRGLVRWLPVLVPLTLLVAHLGAFAWSATLIVGGWTVGERTLQAGYAKACVVPAVLSMVAFWAVRRADHDARWRRLAWACAAAGTLMLAAPGFSP